MIAFIIVVWFELNRIRQDRLDLEDRFDKALEKLDTKVNNLGNAFVADLETANDNFDKRISIAEEYCNDSIHELAVLISTMKYGPEDGEEDNTSGSV